jgi:hypothetical protein
MTIYLLAGVLGAFYYTVGFLGFWLAATPYAKNLGTETFADGIWGELFPYWVVGQIILTLWVCVAALALPIAPHRALAAGIGASFLSLAGLLFLGLEDAARAWLDVIGIIAGIAIGLAIDVYARSRSIPKPSAWHLLWLWVPGAVFLASALLLINSALLALLVTPVSADAFWFVVPPVTSIPLIMGWSRLRKARTLSRTRTTHELLGALMILSGAVAPALIAAFLFRGLFLPKIGGF